MEIIPTLACAFLFTTGCVFLFTIGCAFLFTISNWLNSKMTAWPLGYSEMKAIWPLHFDGMMFTKTMYPSVFIQDKKE